MQKLTPEEFQQAAWELSNELDNLISYDEWAGREYGETRVDYYDTACNIIKAGYRKGGEMQMRIFFDIELREIITDDVLAETLEELKENDPNTYGDMTLEQYINNCLTINNGTLEEV